VIVGKYLLLGNRLPELMTGVSEHTLEVVQTSSPEVRYAEQFRFPLLQDVGDRDDIVVEERVPGAQRQVKLFQLLIERLTNDLRGRVEFVDPS